MFRNPNAYGNKGCPYNCHLYNGVVDWKAGMCPVAEDVIPRMVYVNNMSHDMVRYRHLAEVMKEAIILAESGNVAPLTMTILIN